MKSNKVNTIYKEEIRSGNIQLNEPKFNWIALLIWISSLIISLVPIYIPLIQHLDKHNGQITSEFWFACFKEYDILWVFATVLLFSCVNHVTGMCKNIKSGKSSPNSITALTIAGLMLFAVIEAVWIAFKYFLNTYQSWPIYCGSVLILLSIIIATPLQINFIMNEE